jgi:hypothetical protein
MKILPHAFDELESPSSVLIIQCYVYSPIVGLGLARLARTPFVELGHKGLSGASLVRVHRDSMMVVVHYTGLLDVMVV